MSIKFTLYITLFALLFSVSNTYALTLDEYLNEVHNNNSQYASALMIRDAALKSSAAQSDLVTGIYLKIQDSFNANLANPKFLDKTYDNNKYNQVTVSLQNNSEFGLQTTLSYALQSGKYSNDVVNGTSIKYFNAQPSLTISQSLWQNGFGRGTRAKSNQLRYAGLAQYYDAQNTINNIDYQATNTYWVLVVSKKKIEAKEESLKSVQNIYDYMNRRASMLLSENSDVAQANASLENSRLALLNEKNNYTVQLQNFNLLRNHPASEEPTNLEEISEKDLLAVHIPTELQKYKADILTAKYNLLAAASNYVSVKENYKPSLDLVGQISATGSSTTSSTMANNNATISNANGYIGLSFSIPLNVVNTYNAVSGAGNLADAQSLSYKQLKLQQESAWNTLLTQVKQTQELLEQSARIVKAQKTKLDIETARLQSGRTTTSQVLLFQVDYNTSKSNYYDVVLAMHSLLAQVKNYNVTDIEE